MTGLILAPFGFIPATTTALPIRRHGDACYPTLMRLLCVVLVFLFAATTSSAATDAAPVANLSSPSGARLAISFDSDWRFLKADAPGAEKPDFSDAAWRTLRIPHDWSIEGPFDEKNPAGSAGGFLPAGTGWYRRHFTLPAGFADRRVWIEFDGVMANSDVWINGFNLGHRPYGYVGFRYDLTGHLKFGDNQINVLAVRADNSAQPASRWYAGAGIYRHVRIVAVQPVHIEPGSTFVTTPAVAADRAVVHVHSQVINQSTADCNVTLQATILANDGRPLQTAETITQTTPAGKSAEFDQDLAVREPRIWDLEHPDLYRVIVTARAGADTLDDETITFGIRDIRFDAASGFWLNGKNLKLQGVCLHQDGGAVGVAVPRATWERRLAALKQIGVNAIRTAHHPPSPEFLDLCDRLGFLVMDELFDCWTVGKNPYDYHLAFNDWSLIDTRDTVRRDRNHPCIVLYSAGNEIHDTPNAELAKKILVGLIAVFHENDPTRPVTQALLRPNRSRDYDNGLADLLDVIGTNYRHDELIAAHEAKPTRKIVGTENRHDLESWLAVRDHPFYAGEFIWSGIDYLGEAHFWPNIASSSGLLDRTGTIRPDGYQFQSWWSDRPMVYAARRIAPTSHGPVDPGYGPVQAQRYRRVLFADWNPTVDTPHEENVEVYSNCDQVELFLNGRSLGAQDRPADLSPRNWKVTFAPGTLEAVGRNHGAVAARYELRTAGTPARIVLTADRRELSPQWDDVDCVSANVVDEHGVLVPDASKLISFQITGPGVIAAVDGANNASHESFQATERHAFQGRCLALIRATAASGRITVSASSPGLIAGSVELEANPAGPP